MNPQIQPDARNAMAIGDMDFRYVMELDDLDPLWNKLGANSGQRDPFYYLPAWQLVFNDSYDPKSRVLIRQSNDSLIAFSQRSVYPYQRNPLDYYLKSIEHGWCFGSNILEPNGAEVLFDALIEFERFYWPRFSPIMISGIAPQSATYKALKKYFSKGFIFHRYKTGYPVWCLFR